MNSAKKRADVLLLLRRMIFSPPFASSAVVYRCSHVQLLNLERFNYVSFDGLTLKTDQKRKNIVTDLLDFIST